MRAADGARRLLLISGVCALLVWPCLASPASVAPNEDKQEIERLREALRLMSEENSALRMRLAQTQNVGEEIAFRRSNQSFNPFSLLNSGGSHNNSAFWLNNETAGAVVAIESTVVPPLMGE